MGDVGSDSGAAPDVVERELSDEGVRLEEERQGLSDSAWIARKMSRFSAAQGHAPAAPRTQTLYGDTAEVEKARLTARDREANMAEDEKSWAGLSNSTRPTSREPRGLL